MRYRYWAIAILFAVAACSSGEKSATENSSGQDLSAAKPEKNDEYRTLMAKNLLNYQNMTVGFMNFDMAKIQTAAGNLVATSQYLSDNIPAAYKSQSIEWKERCEELNKDANDILQRAQSKNPEGLRASFQNLMKTCMECHMLYRKHLLKGSSNSPSAPSSSPEPAGSSDVS